MLNFILLCITSSESCTRGFSTLASERVLGLPEPRKLPGIWSSKSLSYQYHNTAPSTTRPNLELCFTIMVLQSSNKSKHSTSVCSMLNFPSLNKSISLGQYYPK